MQSGNARRSAARVVSPFVGFRIKSSPQSCSTFLIAWIASTDKTTRHVSAGRVLEQNLNILATDRNPHNNEKKSRNCAFADVRTLLTQLKSWGCVHRGDTDENADPQSRPTHPPVTLLMARSKEIADKLNDTRVTVDQTSSNRQHRVKSSTDRQTFLLTLADSCWRVFSQSDDSGDISVSQHNCGAR